MTGTNTAVVRRQVRAERDERLGLYATVAAACTLFALFGGGLRLMVIGVPFTVAIALGTRRRDPASIAIQVSLEAVRCVEGDTIAGRIDIDAPADLAVEVAVHRTTDDVIPPDDEPWAWSIPVGVDRPVGVPITVHAIRWGRSTPGTIEVRLVDHGSLLQRRAMALDLPALDVLPAGRRIDRLLDLTSAQTAAGVHTTRRLATGGYEFAEIRDYQPGDRVRDLNWSATLRHDTLQVNHRFPERSGDVVIVIDSFPDALRRHSEVGRDVITWAGRLAWSIASAHLASNDRVGLAVAGARTRWLSPQTGRRAKLAIFQMLLEVTASSGDRRDPADVQDRIQVPPGALVVAVTPLARPRTLQHLASMRANGHVVEVLALDTGALLEERAATLPITVLRIRSLLFDERIASLRRQGIHVVAVDPGDHVARSIRTMSRARRRFAGPS